VEFVYPEGATPLDPDESEGLLLTHITTRAELDRWEQENIVEALSWLDRNKPTDILNEPFVKKLHSVMFGHVWKWAGKFRCSDKTIGGPWYLISTALKNLCDDARIWIELQQEAPDELAVRFHHRLVSIRPFPNGNGRHARLMTDVMLENVMKRPRFTWGSENLVEPGDSRIRYISALRSADGYDYEPLRKFVRT